MQLRLPPQSRPADPLPAITASIVSPCCCPLQRPKQPQGCCADSAVLYCVGFSQFLQQYHLQCCCMNGLPECLQLSHTDSTHGLPQTRIIRSHRTTQESSNTCALCNSPVDTGFMTDMVQKAVEDMMLWQQPLQLGRSQSRRAKMTWARRRLLAKQGCSCILRGPWTTG